MPTLSVVPKTPYSARYREVAQTLPGHSRDWVRARREEGLSRFENAGIPTRKVEAWKYTDLRALAKVEFQPTPTADALSSRAVELVAAVTGDDHLAVFVNGRFRADLSALGALPEGARIESLAAGLESGDGFVADHLGRLADLPDRPFRDLNDALLTDGLALRIPRGVTVDAPIRVLFVTDHEGEPVSHHPRLLIVAEEASQATVVEDHRGPDGQTYFSNGVTEISVGEGAHVHHYKRQSEGEGAFHLSTVFVHVAKDATYDSFILSDGAGLARNDIYARLDGTGADCRLSGAYLGRRRQHMDTTTLIDHAMPDGTSREVYKGVLDGKARGVFQGKIIVRRDAQRTDGYQLNRALLLSREAEIDSKPELEIYADDVKCSHGATVGEIDAEALFYLRARGIGEKEARSLLVEAFVQDALEEVRVDAVREEFAALVRTWMEDAETA